MILLGDCRELLPTLDPGSVRCCVTSPPYWGLRDYGCTGQIGLEKTPEAYVAEIVAVFREVRRVLADDGTLWLNLGDSYGERRLAGRDRMAMCRASRGPFVVRAVAPPRRQAPDRRQDEMGGVRCLIASISEGPQSP